MAGASLSPFPEASGSLRKVPGSSPRRGSETLRNLPTDWGDGSVSKDLPCKLEDPSSSPRTHKKMWGVVACTHNSSGGQGGTGKAPGAFVLAGEVQAVSQKKKSKNRKIE